MRVRDIVANTERARQPRLSAGARTVLIAALLVVTATIGVARAADEAAIAYSLVTLVNGSKELAARFNPAQIAVLEKLNRVDATHLARQRQIVVPEPWATDELAYSPLPLEYAAAAPLAKLLIVEQAQQVFGAYENGSLRRWGPVSTGRKTSPTPPGRYALNWRSPGRHSTVDPEWFLRWYFNFDNRRGLSLHEYDLPGRPESHSCVRLLGRDARWVYDWGEEWRLDETQAQAAQRGTPLVIVGTYAFTAPPPWLLPGHLGAKIVLPAELDSE